MSRICRTRSVQSGKRASGGGSLLVVMMVAVVVALLPMRYTPTKGSFEDFVEWCRHLYSRKVQATEMLSRTRSLVHSGAVGELSCWVR
jgi:hypothetical protein